MDPVEAGSERVERVRLAPEQRRQALIETALAMFAATPYAAVSVDELAREAGMSRPLLYHYFGNKLGVFLAALEHAADLLVAAVAAAAAEAPDGDWLTAGIRAYLDHVRVEATGYGALFDHGAGTASAETAEGGARGDAILDRMRARLLDLLLSGLRVPGDVPPVLRTVLAGWIDMVAVVARDGLRDGLVPVEVLVAVLRDLFGQAVRTAARHDPASAAALRQARGLAGTELEPAAADGPGPGRYSSA